MSKYKAETAVSLLVAILLFSMLVLVFNHWQSEQNRQLNLHFQRQQGMQILENQLALKLAGLDCETDVLQNQIKYEIQCSANQTSIRFALGKIELNND